MFCNKCGSEIAEDSIYCSYCGTKQVPDAPNWDEREHAASAARRQSVMDDGCIHPNAPRKICQGCQKELPSSTTEDYCAICTMKNTHAQEAMEDRKIEQQKRKQESQRQAQNRQNPQKARQVTSYYNESTTQKNENPKGGMNGCLIAILAVVGVFVLLGVIVAIIGFFSYSKMESANADEVMVSSSSESFMDLDEIIAGFEEAQANASTGEAVDIYELPAYDVETLYDTELLGLAGEVANFLPYDNDTLLESTFDRETLSADGGYIYLQGTVSRVFNGVILEQPVVVGFVDSNDSAIQLFLSVEDEIILDNRPFIARDGSFNPETEWETFGWDSEEYGSYFSTPVYELAEMEGGENLAPLPAIVTANP